MKISVESLMGRAMIDAAREEGKNWMPFVWEMFDGGCDSGIDTVEAFLKQWDGLSKDQVVDAANQANGAFVFPCEETMRLIVTLDEADDNDGRMSEFVDEIHEALDEGLWEGYINTMDEVKSLREEGLR